MPKRFRPHRTGLILPRQDKVHRVRNVETERVLPCCWDTCQKDGDNRIQVRVPHDSPRWPGDDLTLIYIFCSTRHRDAYIALVLQARV
jgi:hypothetical protein